MLCAELAASLAFRTSWSHSDLRGFGTIWVPAR